MNTAAAQELTLPDISLSAVPINPAPGQTVIITATSLGTDLSQASINWSYGNKVVATGLGKTKLAVTAPEAGSSALVTATVSGTGSAAISASILLNPGSVDMLWEATDAYTPPFYKGKALLPVQGNFKVVAVSAINAPRSITYTWVRNGSALQSASGLNKNSISLENTIFNEHENIAVSLSGGGFQGAGSISIPTITPTIVGYQKKEGFIDYLHGSTKDILIATSGTTLHFEPYFFSIRTKSIFDSIQIGLSVDDQVVAGDPVENELRISKPDGDGTHKIGVEISTIAYSVQRAAKAFSLIFQ